MCYKRHTYNWVLWKLSTTVSPLMFYVLLIMHYLFKYLKMQSYSHKEYVVQPCNRVLSCPTIGTLWHLPKSVPYINLLTYYLLASHTITIFPFFCVICGAGVGLELATGNGHTCSWVHFYRASALLTHDIDIADLSVHLFVCPLHSGIRWKRLNISS